MSMYLVSRAVRIAAGAVLAVVMLGWIANKVGGPGTAVIHVTESDVIVGVDGLEFAVKARRYEPIVLELQPGPHAVTMSRGDERLYEGEFRVKANADAVVTLYDTRRDGGPPLPWPGGPRPVIPGIPAPLGAIDTYPRPPDTGP